MSINYKPLVSIIIPCFNQGRWLCESIDSALSSTYKNIEIIVVDDGSTDLETRQVLDGLDKPKVKLIRQRNQGLCVVRNNAIKFSSGDFILSLDSDDILAPNFIEHALKCFSEHPDVYMVGGDFVYLYDDTKTLSEPVNGLRNAGYMTSKIMSNNIITSNYIYRRELVQKVGGFSKSLTRLAIEDVDFTMRVYKLGYKIYVLPEISLQYRQHGISMNNNQAKRRFAKTIVFLHHIDWFIWHPRHAAAFFCWRKLSHLLDSLPYTTLEIEKC